METLQKTTFVDLPNTTTPVDADFLNDLQDNIINNFSETDTRLTSNSSSIGTLSSLATTEKDNLVGATNEVNGKLGNLSNLNTTNKNNLVDSINEVNGKLDNLIESGSNSSGKYLKFDNGVMIQYQRYSTNVAINTVWGAWYYGTAQCPDFPQEFVGELPTITATIYPTTGNWCIGTLAYGSGKPQSMTTAGTILCCKPEKANNVPVDIEIIAVGRWK